MEDDEFGGDDFDTINDTFLEQLEQTAFTSTQSAKAGAPRGPQRPGIQVYGVAGLSRSNTASKGGWRPPQPRRPLLQQQQQQQDGPPASAPDPPSSDYGFDDEDVIDLDEPSTVMPSTSALPSRGRTETPAPVPAKHARYGSKAALDPETEAAFAAADAELATHNPGQWTHAPHLQPKLPDGIDVSALQTKIAELEAEQARLRSAEEEARKAAMAKQGEIAIVRLNHEKATKEYEHRIRVMQKLHADANAKQKAELEAGRKQREKMETDNRFLQHDLAQESERTRRLAGPEKPRAAPGMSGTPNKSRRTALGDGFDDDEVHMASPSRSKDKSREQTPKAGIKRKRPAQDSPIAPLSFTQPARDTGVEQQPPKVDTRLVQEQSRYAFMQRTLNHRPYEGHERTVEALTKYSFPSDENESLSSILVRSLTSTLPAGEVNFPLKLARTMLGLWRRCLEEKYYKPVYLILEMTQSALRTELSTTVCQLIEEAVPICVRTINLVMDPVFQSSTYHSYATSPEYTAVQTKIAPHIDVDEVLEFLKRLCDAATLSPEAIQLFWRRINFESVLLWLSKAQPISQTTIALRMLVTSCMSTSFGSICDADTESESQTQTQEEKSVIERLTSMLFETPQAPKDEPAYSDHEILDFRLEVLRLMKALCQNDHGGLLLAQSRTAIGRLIRFLDAQVGRLYTTRPAIGLALLTDEKPLHSLVAATINATVRLIYHLLRAHSEVINLQQRLAVVKGGWHKFLVSMTRIAFSDRLVFEEGLDEESVEAAHQILDGVLSPEEGEAVVRAVETPRGTKGTATEKDSEGEGDDPMEPG
jgi:hypothetical protein